MGKGENVSRNVFFRIQDMNHHLQYIQLSSANASKAEVIILTTLDLSSANVFNLDQPQTLLSGKGLTF